MVPSRSTKASLQAWLVLALRTLFLAALLLVAFYGNRLSDQLLLLYVLWLVVTLVISAGRMVGWSPGWSVWITSLLDLVFATYTIALTGYFESPLWWSILIGAISLGILLGIRWSLLFTGIAILVTSALSGMVTGESAVSVTALAIRIAILLVSTWILSWFARWILEKMIEIEEEFARHSVQIQEKERQRARAFYRLAADLTSSLEPRQVLERTLDLSADALIEEHGGKDGLVGALLLLRDGVLTLISGQNLRPEDYQRSLNADDPVYSWTMDQVGSSIHTVEDPETSLTSIAGFQGCKEVLAVPLSVNGEPYGLFLFGHPEAGYFWPEQVELLDAISIQAMIAYNNALLYQDLEDEKERITEIQDEARKKLARDLHDGPTQTMAAITMRVNFAQRLIGRDPDSATEELIKVEDMARKTTKEIRHMLFTLRPLILETQGLVAALYQLADKMWETHRQKVVVDANLEHTLELDPGTQGVLFYIAEEAVNNARKHAEAEQVWIRLSTDPQNIYLEVVDDGVGFNVGSIDSDYAQRGSLGIVNMRERAELIEATLKIESGEGVGTRVLLEAPRSQKLELHDPPDQQTNDHPNMDRSE
jgi:signal transduction histidine kinase